MGKIKLKPSTQKDELPTAVQHAWSLKRTEYTWHAPVSLYAEQATAGTVR